MKKRSKESTSAVTEEKAREHVQLALNLEMTDEICGFKGLGSTAVDNKPLIIHDLNGKVLFYEYEIKEGDAIVGVAKGSADKLVGSAVPQIQLGPRRWSPEKSLKKAEDIVKKQYPNVKISKSEFVCYSYPKIGARIYIDDPKSGETSLIFDVSSLSLVETFGKVGFSGFTAWSFLNEVGEADAIRRERRWELQDKELEVFKSEIPKLFEGSSESKDIKDVQKALADYTMYQPNKLGPNITPIPLTSQKIIQYCKHCQTHDCYALHAQMTDHHCAVASGQMLFDFYRYYYDQNQIGTAMSIGPYGCSITGIMDGLKNLTYNCMNITLDSSPTWGEAAAEIDNNRPLMTLIPGHARTCFGWKASNIWIVTKPRPQWLYVLDPWPWNADICKGGAIYWEDWYAINHTYFIYLQHRTTLCK